MLIIPRRMTTSFDPEAAAWIALIEAADGQSLEPAVKDAYNAFVTGSKADASLNPGVSNWTATEQLLLMRGPRTLTSALIPMKGTNPTNVGFGSGDYNRKLDLKGNGAKYLNLNRSGQGDLQNNASGWLWINRAATTNNTKYWGAQTSTPTVQTYIGDFSGAMNLRLNSQSGIAAPAAQYTGFVGINRNSSSLQTARYNSVNVEQSHLSFAPPSLNYFLFARNIDGTPNGQTDAGISAYGSGKAINLASMQSRIDALMTALTAAIP